MTNNEFRKLMASLMQQSDWPVVYKQIRAEIESNDPLLNALIDQFVQITPTTQSETRIMFYLLLSSEKMLVLAHLNGPLSQGLQEAAGLLEPAAALE